MSKALERYSLEKTTWIQDARKYNLENLQSVVEDQQKFFDSVFSSSFYYFSSEEKNEKKTPRIMGDFIGCVLDYIPKQVRVWEKSQEWFRNFCLQTTEKSMSFDEQFPYGDQIITHGYSLVKTLDEINKAKYAPPGGISYINPIEQIKIKNYIRSLPEKPEGFREILRRYMPRWMWHPFPFPEEFSGYNSEPVIRQKWEEAGEGSDVLTNSEISKTGLLPIHRIFRCASALRTEGLHTEAYFLKTWAICRVVKEESDRTRDEHIVEAPFFYVALPALVEGKTKTMSFPVYFDFQKEVSSIMHQTFSGLISDSEQLASHAISFLDALASAYPSVFPKMITASFFHDQNIHGKDNELDVLSTIRSLQTPWAEDIISATAAIQGRRMLFSNEVEEVMTHLLRPDTVSVSEEDFGTFVNTIVGEDDSIRMSVPLTKLGYTRFQEMVSLDIEVDKFSETVYGVLKLKKEKISKHLPFIFTFVNSEAQLSFELFEGQVDQQLSAPLIQVIFRTFLREQEKRIQKNQSADSFANSSSAIRLSQQIFPDAHVLTREEKIAKYEENKHKHKKRKQIHKHISVAPEDQEIEKHEENEEVFQPVHWVGLTNNLVQQYLKEEQIEGVSAEFIVKKLQHLATVAKTSKKMLGKHVHYYAIPEEEARGINLRQINLVFDNWATAIRIYAQDIGGGDFLLRGILRKKGEKQ